MQRLLAKEKDPHVPYHSWDIYQQLTLYLLILSCSYYFLRIFLSSHIDFQVLLCMCESMCVCFLLQRTGSHLRFLRKKDLLFIYLYYFWPHCRAYGILVPSKGLNPCPLHWKLGVFTREVPRSFSKNSFFLYNLKRSHSIYSYYKIMAIFHVLHFSL